MGTADLTAAKRRVSTKKVVAIDIFCGAGGMSLGLQRAGIKVVCGVDNDPIVLETYKKNVHSRALCRDIRRVTSSDLRPFVPKNARLIISVCAPCQPFSKVRKSGKQRTDGQLLLEVGRLIRSLRPDGVIVENVPQISRLSAKGVLNEFQRILSVAGYSFAVGVLDAKYYGVPQTRARMVLLAVRGRDRPVRLPRAHKGAIRTVRDAIALLPKVDAGFQSNYHPLHSAAHLSKLNHKRLRATPLDGGDSRAWPKGLRLRCHVKSGGFYDVYGRMRWDHPAPTLTTRCISLSNGRFGHPEQARAITLLEAALLQTFPRRYKFEGNQGDIARQIGNAVPARLARALGAALVRQL